MTEFKNGSWKNWLDDFEFKGPIATPSTQAELLNCVADAVAQGFRVRAVGSGHSYSQCARPRERVVDLRNLRGVFSDVQWRREPPRGLAAGEHFVRVKAGTPIKELNRRLLPARSPDALGLPNMGTFDAQTVAGAISTGTHGTGTRLGSLADLVATIDLATTRRLRLGHVVAEMVRIEPTNGVTDPVAFEADRDEHGMTLIQDDDVFHAAVVSYGCMGIAFAYTLKVVREYWLSETNEATLFSELRRRLDATIEIGGDAVPRVADGSRNFVFVINAAELKGKHGTDDPMCLVTNREQVAVQARPAHWHRSWPPERHGDFWRELGQDLASFNPEKIHDGQGKRIRKAFERDAGKASFVDDRTASASYIVHRREQDDRPDADHSSPPPQALSIELAVRAASIGPLLDAAIAEVASSSLFYSAPISVRFAAASKHFMSSNEGRATAYAEIIIVLPTPIGLGNHVTTRIRDEVAKPELTRLLRALFARRELRGARCHLGKHNDLDGSDIAERFHGFARWRPIYETFNPSGVFDNAFTDQLGISMGSRP